MPMGHETRWLRLMAGSEYIRLVSGAGWLEEPQVVENVVPLSTFGGVGAEMGAEIDPISRARRISRRLGRSLDRRSRQSRL
ncbi:MAG: hypothetical protein QOF94_249 [Acidobacteriaceae bacterium]|jgi:hypothetical protein